MRISPVRIVHACPASVANWLLITTHNWYKAKVSTTSSANIFTNRELESLSRALALRRLTYILLSGPKDRYLTQLPIIQEKLVDLLRAPVGDMVHAEVSTLVAQHLFCG